MKTLAILGLVAVSFGCSGPTSPTPDTASTASSTAHLVDGSGRTVGKATLSETRDGVRVIVDVAGLPPGDKAVHIHEVGHCEAPSFDSAKAHFNPTGKEHGLANPRGPHGGDLPNISIDASGQGRLDVTTNQITLRQGPASLFDADGSALIIHAAPDDMRSVPAGNSGSRIACGAIASAARG
jgi:superoxide dismutase, Cu-Zn family